MSGGEWVGIGVGGKCHVSLACQSESVTSALNNPFIKGIRSAAIIQDPHHPKKNIFPCLDCSFLFIVISQIVTTQRRSKMGQGLLLLQDFLTKGG